MFSQPIMTLPGKDRPGCQVMTIGSHQVYRTFLQQFQSKGFAAGSQPSQKGANIELTEATHVDQFC